MGSGFKTFYKFVRVISYSFQGDIFHNATGWFRVENFCSDINLTLHTPAFTSLVVILVITFMIDSGIDSRRIIIFTDLR